RPIEAKIVDDRLEERPDGVPHARREERGDGEGRDDPPAVEDRALSHGVCTIAQRLRRGKLASDEPARARRRSRSVSLAEGDAVPLGQTIERAAVDSEELRGELLVPPRLLEDAAHVAGDDVAQAQWRHAVPVRRAAGVAELGREIARENEG